MKKLLLSLFILWSSISRASEQSLELVGPGITWHVIDGGASYMYDHPISSDGRLIYTPEIGIKKTYIDNDWTYHSLALFTADNSIGSPIWGGVGGVGVYLFHILSLGFAGGGYVQNNNDFYAKGITPFSMTSGTNAFVPLMGFEINCRDYISDKIFISFNNLITPIITNSTLSVGFKY